MLLFSGVDEIEEKQQFALVSKEFGAALKRVRKKKGLSSTKIARLLLTESGNYLNLENKDPNPQLKTIWRVCTALNINMSELFLEMERGGEKAKD